MEIPVFQMILSLAGVLLLMFGISKVAKRFVGSTKTSKSQRINIEILGHRMLQPKQALYVLKVCNKGYIVSSTEQKIQLLGEIEENDLQYHLLHETLNASTSKQSIVNSTRDFVTQFPSIQELFSVSKQKSKNVIKKRTGSMD